MVLNVLKNAIRKPEDVIVHITRKDNVSLGLEWCEYDVYPPDDISHDPEDDEKNCYHRRKKSNPQARNAGDDRDPPNWCQHDDRRGTRNYRRRNWRHTKRNQNVRNQSDGCCCCCCH